MTNAAKTRPVTLIWSLFPASGVIEFPTVASAAEWTDEQLAISPAITIKRA
jgi:hypothetical protein